MGRGEWKDKSKGKERGMGRKAGEGRRQAGEVGREMERGKWKGRGKGQERRGLIAVGLVRSRTACH